MKKILLVEDNIYLREMYEEALTVGEFSITLADDDAQALEKIKQGQFDLILIDILLAKLNDMEVLKELKKEDSPYKNIPILLLTNLGDDNLLQEAIDLGAEGSLSKAHIKPAELVEKITDFFTNKEANQ